MTDETAHPPARSGTPTAWITLGLIVVLLAGWFFSGQIAGGVIRGVLFGATLVRGERLHVEKLTLDPNGGIELRGIEWDRGSKEHRSSLKCDWAVIRLESPWRMLFGSAGRDRRLIREITAGKSKLLADLRDTPGTDTAAKSGGRAAPWVLPSAEKLPVSLVAGPSDIVVIGETFRLAVNGLQLNLPDRWPGKMALSGATVDVGSRRATIPKGSASALWDGNTLRFGTLGLGEGIALKELTLSPMHGRLEFGLRGVIGKGILRGDGSFGREGHQDRLEITLVGERLGLEAFAGLLKDPQQATGTINQARFTFRGNPSHPLEADSALRLVAKNFHWEGKGWETLRISATLTGRTLTLSELLLRQGDNELEAVGQSRLPEDWRTILRAPFSANFSASLADAGSLAAIAGPGFAPLGGGLAFEGEVHGVDNKAEGYCNLVGNGTRIRDLSVDWLKGNILFEGEKTRIAYLEASSGSDRIAGEGTVSNRRPHDYSAKAEVNVRNLIGRLGQLGLDTAAAIGSGSVKGTWRGEGNNTNHTGSFVANVTEWVSPMTSAGMSGRFEGSYTPGHLTFTKANFVQDDLTLSMQLALTPENIAATSIKASREGVTKPVLEGSVTLPVDANDFRASGDLIKNLSMDHPLSLDLRMHGIKAEDLANALGQKSGFSGTLDGEIYVTGTPGTPEIKSAIRIGKFAPQGGATGQDLTLVGETLDHRLTLRIDQEPAATSPLSIRATLPLQLANDHGHLRLDENAGSVEGSLKLQGTPLDGWIALLGMKQLWPLVDAKGSGEVKIGGTVGKPALSGSLSIQAREARLFGPEKLQNITTPFLMDGKTPTLALKNGAATYAGRPVSLSGTITAGGDELGALLKISGNDIPVSLGCGLSATGTADLELTAKAAHDPVLGGSVMLKPCNTDLAQNLTPCFTPPGLPMAGQSLARTSATSGAFDNLQLDLKLKTSDSSGKTNPVTPLITLDLYAKGAAQSPKITGNVTACNQTLQLPSGSFILPEAQLVMDGTGVRMESAPAFGFTKIGPCVLTPFIDATGSGCGITGPAGVTAADLIMTLASPSPRRGDTGMAKNFSPILQGTAWLRQNALFPLPATVWSIPSRDVFVPGALGFYGTPWTWNWSEKTAEKAGVNTPNNTSR